MISIFVVGFFKRDLGEDGERKAYDQNILYEKNSYIKNLKRSINIRKKIYFKGVQEKAGKYHEQSGKKYMMWEWLATTLPSCEEGETLSAVQKEENQILNGIISTLELGYC